MYVSFPDSFFADDGALPQDYDPNEELKFSEGMYGSQAMLGSRNEGPQLPGMENLGADAVVTGGIETASGIPEVSTIRTWHKELSCSK